MKYAHALKVQADSMSFNELLCDLGVSIKQSRNQQSKEPYSTCIFTLRLSISKYNTSVETILVYQIDCRDSTLFFFYYLKLNLLKIPTVLSWADRPIVKLMPFT